MLRRKHRSAHRNFYGKFRRKSPKPRPGSRPATPRARRKILRSLLRNPDASQRVTFTSATRRVTSLYFHPSVLQTIVCLLLLTLLAGCGPRHITANPPAPSQPSSASPETIESTKRGTDAGPAPATPSPTPAPKRSKPSQGTAPAGYTEEGNA